MGSGGDWLQSRFSCEGKRVLVTGASRGIGQALALGFAHAGADLVIAARDTASLSETASAIKQIGRHAELIAFDQSDTAQIKTELRRCAQRWRLTRHYGARSSTPI
jgi:NAD(P)-dependent dehydrogenase (short-subunit alcohol dehydrogenase family)